MLRSGSVIRITFRRPKRPYRELLPLVVEVELVAVETPEDDVDVVVVEVEDAVVEEDNTPERPGGERGVDLTTRGFMFLLEPPPLPGSAGKLSFCRLN